VFAQDFIHNLVQPDYRADFQFSFCFSLGIATSAKLETPLGCVNREGVAIVPRTSLLQSIGKTSCFSNFLLLSTVWFWTVFEIAMTKWFTLACSSLLIICINILIALGITSESKPVNESAAPQFVLLAGVLPLAEAPQDAQAKPPPPVAPVVAPAQAFVVPFEDHPIIYVQGKINGKIVAMGFDTGAPNTVMSAATAQALGVRGGVADISLGDIQVNGHRVSIENLGVFRDIQQIYGVKIAAILGYPFLSQFVITFDYQKKQLTLVPANNAPPLVAEPGSFIAPFTLNPRHHWPFLEIKINGKGPFTFFLDSGAQETMVKPAIAQQVGIVSQRQQNTNYGLVGYGKADSISVGDAEAKNVAVAICVHPNARQFDKVGQRCDGFLGRSFFAKFKLVLDYRTKQVQLTPN
jgi:predicted aspartyl protease